MKRFILSIAISLLSLCAFAQNPKNNTADSIIGKYESVQGTDAYKVEITRKADGTYKAKLFWTADSVDPKTGKKYLDPKNPDKSLRNTPCDQITLIDGLKYNSAKKLWNEAKIYDPQRGIKVNVTCMFLKDGRLSLRGSVLGIGETVYWTPIK